MVMGGDGEQRTGIVKDAQMKATEISLANAEKEMQEMKAKGFNTKWYYSLKPQPKGRLYLLKSGSNNGSDLSADEKTPYNSSKETQTTFMLIT